MKKLATLEVWEVETTDDQETLAESSQYNRKDADTHRVILNPHLQCPECPPYNKVDVLAHELGHFVTHLFELPSAVADSNRNMFAFVLGVDTRPPEEKAAWNIAEKMGLNLDQQAKAQALISYGVPLSEVKF